MTLEEIERIRTECKTLVRKRALLAAAGAALPIPALDIAVDLGVLSTMIPDISRRFGLSKEQVDELDDATRLFVFEIVRQTGAKLVARAVTRETLVSLLSKIGRQAAAQRFGRFIPVVGSVLSGGLSYAAMKYLGENHIEECYKVAKRLAARKTEMAAVIEAPAAQRPPKEIKSIEPARKKVKAKASPKTAPAKTAKKPPAATAKKSPAKKAPARAAVRKKTRQQKS